MARFYDPDDERLVWDLGPEPGFDGDEEDDDPLYGTLDSPEQLPDDWDEPDDRDLSPDDELDAAGLHADFEDDAFDQE